jgi:DNA-binding CsgD family transcriptional regulator/tetratricopeptide (TPR) repeat protein
MSAEQRFVGRSSELTALVGALDQAVAGRTTNVLVTGDAGIGKTRLLEEFGRLAGSRSVPVVWGRATNEEGAPPFWPWRQILRGWLAGTDPGAAQALLGGAADDLTRIAPELRALTGATPDSSIGPALAGTEQRFALFEVLCDFLVAAAADHGLVLVLDDLHWADTASLLLLAHLVRHVRDARLLVAGALRPLEARRAGEPGEVLADIGRQRSITRLDLAGVTPTEVGEQLTHTLGHRPDDATVATVAQRTAGNPLFVQEVGRLLASRAPPRPDADGDGGLVPDADGGLVPDAVRAVIVERLGHLSPSCRGLLAVAAVVSVDVEPRLLAAIAGTGLDAVLSGLDEALAGGIVVRSRLPAGYRFEHDLVRDSLRLEVPTAERARAHLRAAEHLTATDVDGHRSEIAHHRLESLPVGDPLAAIEATGRAAELALRQLAFEDAAALYRRVLDATRGAGVDGRARCGLLVEKARAEHLAGDVNTAIASVEEAAALAQQAGDAEGLARAAVVMPDVSSPEWLPRVDAWCQEALAGLDPADSPLRSQLLAQQALAWVFVGAVEEMAAVSAESLAMAERLDDPTALLIALRARQMALSTPGGVAERVVVAERMQRLGVRTRDAAAVMWGHLWSFDALVQLGRIDEAESQLDRLEPVVARMRQPLGRWHLARSRAAIDTGRGRFADAIAATAEANALAGLGQHHIALMGSEAVKTVIATLTGADLVDPLSLPAVLRLPPPLGPLVRLARAEWHLAHGRHDEAAELCERLPPSSWRPPSFFTPTYHAYRGVVAAGLGDGEAAAAAYEQLLPHAAVHVASGAGVILTRGSTERFLGVSAAASGRLDAAVDHLRAAVAANRAAGLHACTAESQGALADVLHRRGGPGDRDHAVVVATEAEATATRLGMAPVRGRAQAMLADLGRPGGPGGAGGPLSRREHEIARLVARGLTNRQIAAEAHIAERTAENHVQHILTKLGFSTRSQIATWVTARTLGPTRSPHRP